MYFQDQKAFKMHILNGHDSFASFASEMSSVPNTVGYYVKFVSTPPASLQCLICQLTAREPQQHGTCGKLFCSSCITTYQQQNKTLCPYCRQELIGTLFSDHKSKWTIFGFIFLTPALCCGRKFSFNGVRILLRLINSECK